MKKLWKITFAVLLAVLVVAALALAACNSNDNPQLPQTPDGGGTGSGSGTGSGTVSGTGTGTGTGSEHQHTFAKEWSSDDIEHWHDPTCNDTTERADVATHDFQQIDYTAPTCTETGISVKKCTVCQKTVTETLKATGHSFSEDWNHNDDYHWHDAICGHSEKSELDQHVFGNDNTCDTCGYERVVEASVLEVQNAQIEGLNIFMLVEPTVSDVPLAQAVKVSKGCLWTLSYDKIGNDVINSKVATQKKRSACQRRQYVLHSGFLST